MADLILAWWSLQLGVSKSSSSACAAFVWQMSLHRLYENNAAEGICKCLKLTYIVFQYIDFTYFQILCNDAVL